MHDHKVALYIEVVYLALIYLLLCVMLQQQKGGAGTVAFEEPGR